MSKLRVKELRTEAMLSMLEYLTPQARTIAEELYALAMDKMVDDDVRRRSLVDLLNLFEDYGREAPMIGIVPQIQVINHMAIPGIESDPLPAELRLVDGRAKPRPRKLVAAKEDSPSARSQWKGEFLPDKMPDPVEPEKVPD